MTNAQKKSEILGKTAKTYCQNWLKSEIYGIQKQIESKYLTKGNVNEQDAMDLLIKHDKELYVKNETKYENEYMTGTPDIVTETEIIDLKCSWNIWTFPSFISVPPQNYWWQLQTYMILARKKKSRLVYALTDTPEDLYEKELDKILNLDIPIPEKEFMFENISKSHKFQRLTTKERLKIFILKDESAETQIIQRVKECREYIKELLTQI